MEGKKGGKGRKEIFPKVYLILLNYNGWADTIEALEGLCRQDYPNFQIVIVDNNSSDNSLEYLQKWARGELELWLSSQNPLRKQTFPPIPKPVPYQLLTEEELFLEGEGERFFEGERGSFSINRQISGVSREKGEQNFPPLKNPVIFIASRENRGFAGGNNLALRWAYSQQDGEFFLLINNDTSAPPNFLSTFLSPILENKKGENTLLKLWGAKIYKYNPPHPLWFCGGEFRWRGSSHWERCPKEYPFKTQFITGCLLLIPSSLLKRVGFLNEEFFLYVEDQEFCSRALKKGFQNWINPEAFIYHKVGATTGKKGTKLEYYYTTRNKLLFCRDGCPNLFPFYAFFFIGTRLLRILQFKIEGKGDLAEGIWDGLVDFWIGRVGKWEKQQEPSPPKK
ncbi:MAG: glycosyltransferase family 2 protein [Campylobacterales bacterium]